VAKTVSPFVREDVGTFLKRINKYRHSENPILVIRNKAGSASYILLISGFDSSINEFSNPKYVMRASNIFNRDK
jgi:hypothetical protein